MNQLWQELKNLATAKKSCVSNSVLSFSKCLSPENISEIIAKAKDSGQDVSSKRLSDVLIYKDYVVKYENKSFKRRFKESQFNLDNPSKGNEGFFGEVYNTLVARHQNMPSHEALGLYFNHLSLKSVIIYKKLSNKSVIEEIRVNPSKIEKLLYKTYDFMYSALESGIYHGDTNTSNIFLSSDLSSGYYIDFELAIPLRCSKEEALCIQVSNMRNRLLVDLISEKDFKKLTIKYLSEKFKNQKLIEIFEDYFHLKLNSKERFKKIQFITNQGSSKLHI
jgi:serine/threonine protein kinase